jgi:hypothetical protein
MGRPGQHLSKKIVVFHFSLAGHALALQKLYASAVPAQPEKASGSCSAQ